MNEELRESIIASCPNLFRHGICFECSDGWLPIIADLSAKLEAIISQYKEPDSYYAVQVKEKYASLRFYMSVTNDTIDKLIEEAEDLSRVTCELCGQPGISRGTRWFQVKCDSCNREGNTKTDV
jgi:hypothetical protein